MGKHSVIRWTKFDSVEDYLLSHIECSNQRGCWEWLGARGKKGYGEGNYGGRRQAIHRLSYAAFISEIPEGMCVCHHCDNPVCINPVHLFLRRHRDNMSDMWRKGRHPGYKLDRDAILEIKSRLLRGESARSLSKLFDVSSKSIRDIRDNKRWSEIGPYVPPQACWKVNKLDAGIIPLIRKLLLMKIPKAEIGRRFGVSRRCIYDIEHRRTWKE